MTSRTDPQPVQPPVRPTATNDGIELFSVLGLALSLFGLVVLSVPLALAALLRIRRQGRQGKGLAVAALVISGLWAVLLVVGTVLLLTTRSGAFEAIPVAPHGQTRIQTGDCLARLDEGAISDVDIVDCRQPHQAEAFAEFDLPASRFPGEAKVRADADRQCATRIPASLASANVKDLSLFYVYPKAASWGLGDRGVICLVISEGAPLTRPLSELAAAGGPAPA